MIKRKDVPDRQENIFLHDNYDIIIKDFKKIHITNMEKLLDDCITDVKSPWIIINMIKTSFKGVRVRL